MSKNRRKHARVQAKGIATHFRAGVTTALAMPVDNVSLGGAFVRTDEPLSPGTAIALELLDGTPEKPMKLTGRVAGVVTGEQAERLGRPAGMGVMFDPLDAPTRARLEKLLHNLRERSHVGGAVVDSDMQYTRKEAFDFGFATLESYGDEAAPRAPERTATPEPFSAPASVPPNLRPKAKTPTPPEQKRFPTPPSPMQRTPTPPPGPAGWQMAPPDASKPVRTEVRVPAPAGQTAVPDEARLMVQVRGLLMELSDMQSKLSQTERENEQLREEVEKLKEQLRRRR